jgi:hypothetical protein
LPPRLVIFCVDGGTPEMANQHDLFRFARGDDVDDERPTALRSVFPSSTAPGHASMLTGVTPGVHGILGNAYWDNDTPVADIRASSDPLASLHPYDHRSLDADSMLDECARRGLTVAAVMFPQTFSLDAGGMQPSTGVFCLYAPTETFVVPGSVGSERRRSSFAFERYGFQAQFDLEERAPGEWRMTCRDDGREWRLAPGRPADVVLYAAGNTAASFSVLLEEASDASVRLTRATGVFAFGFGGAPIERFVDDEHMPHSRSIDYAANPDHDFFEAPTSAWVTSAAHALLADEPDVLLVRYNQVDHAQEHLLWYARHGAGAQQEEAYSQIYDAYRRIEQGMASVVAALPADVPCFVFSDHGIDTIDYHVRIDTALDELGLADDFAFRGDSHCCFLYGDRKLRSAEEDALTALVSSLAAPATVLPEAQLRRFGAYHPNRSGRLACLSAPHSTFQFSPGPIVRCVQLGSHGFDPRLPEMHGIFRPLGRWLGRRPTSILELAEIVRQILR